MQGAKWFAMKQVQVVFARKDFKKLKGSVRLTQIQPLINTQQAVKISIAIKTENVKCLKACQSAIVILFIQENFVKNMFVRDIV